MTKADDTTTTARGAGRIPIEQTARALPHFAGNLSEAVTGAIYTLELFRAELLRESETMDEGGTVSNWAAVIGLVTAGLEEPHEDLGRVLRARAEMAEAAQ